MTRWIVRLSATAQRDYSGIIGYTEDTFGARQAVIYDKTIRLALDALAAGSAPVGSTDRSDLGRDLRGLHVARRGRHGRHIILYRAAQPNAIEVVRILHDAMDFERHLPSKQSE